ncbi:restriction endonuclease [Bacillus solitudinis]|uniref:restriction endonuclease n=1 Tax=Bacillus solitudinis TaxID=2014074 RepID=UPI000C23F7FD|nr:restriction endonuclease [Bacillus solitudinis]
MMRVETIILVVSVFVFFISTFVWFRYHRKYEELTELIITDFERREELLNTIAAGLTSRFHNEKENLNNYYEFVAGIFERLFGGNVYLSLIQEKQERVEMEHQREGEKYILAIKRSDQELGFEQIAMLHSSMVKQNATGGYIITTEGFSDEARSYAIGLNIQMIDGINLVEMWLETLQSQNGYPTITEPLRT